MKERKPREFITLHEFTFWTMLIVRVYSTSVSIKIHISLSLSGNVPWTSLWRHHKKLLLFSTVAGRSVLYLIQGVILKDGMSKSENYPICNGLDILIYILVSFYWKSALVAQGRVTISSSKFPKQFVHCCFSPYTHHRIQLPTSPLGCKFLEAKIICLFFVVVGT